MIKLADLSHLTLQSLLFLSINHFSLILFFALISQFLERHNSNFMVSSYLVSFDPQQTG